MAEAIARKRFRHLAAVQSAGMETVEGLPATKEAIAVMREMGFDISNHRSRDIERLELAEFDRIVAMTPAIASQLQTMDVETERITVIDVPDPYGRGIEVYRSTARKLEFILGSLFGHGSGT